MSSSFKNMMFNSFMIFSYSIFATFCECFKSLSDLSLLFLLLI